MLTKTDLAYTAGIIDGEGSIRIQKHRRVDYYQGHHYCMVVAVCMCDMAVPTWLHLKFGGSLNSYKGRKQGYKREYHWTITTKNAKKFLELILPYLKQKQGQARVAIEFQEMKSAQRGQYHKYNHKPIALLEAEAILAKKVRKLNRGEVDITLS